MRVLIITGGTTSERRISLMSAKCVKAGLEESNHEVKLFDLKKEGISKNLVKDFDVVFPVLHGEEGEGGGLQKQLSTLGIRFIGGSPIGFQQGWYKISFKEFCDREHILTSPWKKIKNQSDIVKFGFPCVLKSSSGGSSREVVILKSAKNLKNNLCRKLLKSGLPLFVERYLPGIEVTVGILKDKALPVIEIIPPAGGWFDYKNKYWGNTNEIPNAPSLTPQLKKMVQKIALRIHKTLKLGHYSRIDFIISDGKPYVLEVNTIPGLTASSLFPKAAAAVGLTFPKLLDKMIKLASNSAEKLA
ncbi:MAG: ATP-grasp domain-containing protein [Candidatus Daviesbacteria bacterium]|nr:ATP-grasp domain-containing protein [Candidatus Daviesbacteria bacterium]